MHRIDELSVPCPGLASLFTARPLARAASSPRGARRPARGSAGPSSDPRWRGRWMPAVLRRRLALPDGGHPTSLMTVGELGPPAWHGRCAARGVVRCRSSRESRPRPRCRGETRATSEPVRTIPGFPLAAADAPELRTAGVDARRSRGDRSRTALTRPGTWPRWPARYADHAPAARGVFSRAIYVLAVRRPVGASARDRPGADGVWKPSGASTAGSTGSAPDRGNVLRPRAHGERRPGDWAVSSTGPRPAASARAARPSGDIDPPGALSATHDPG